jgi:hypothetical protein
VNKARNTMGRYRLHSEVLLWRHGYGWVLLALVLLMVLIAQLFVLPHQLHSQRVASAQLAQLRQAELTRDKGLHTPAQPSREAEILDQLVQVSFSEAGVSDILRSIARIAQRNGVVLSQSEFQNSAEGHGGLSRLQVTLPLRASYPQLKRFVEKVLLEHSGISVDELVLKRESVAQNQVEIRVKLSLWIQPGKRPKAGP